MTSDSHKRANTNTGRQESEKLAPVVRARAPKSGQLLKRAPVTLAALFTFQMGPVNLVGLAAPKLIDFDPRRLVGGGGEQATTQHDSLVRCAPKRSANKPANCHRNSTRLTCQVVKWLGRAERTMAICRW